MERVGNRQSSDRITTMAAIHDDDRALLASMAAAGSPPFEAMTPQDARAMAKQFVGAMAFPPSAVAQVEEVDLPGQRAGRLYRPSTRSPLPALLYLHGGGWMTGDLDSHDDICRRLCHGIDCLVLAVDYRLAPEHPFPAAIDDCFAALRWLHNHADELGVDRDRIVVGGDSAGGSLAAVIAVAARDGLLPPVAYQMLLYPVTDLSTEHPSYDRTQNGLPLTSATMRWFKQAYLSGPSDAYDWRASPLLVPSLAGVAPAFVLTVHHDPLCDEGRAYAMRLVDADVHVTHVHFSQHIHGLVSMGAIIRDAAAAIDMAVAAVSAAVRVFAPPDQAA
jgi:acetyl esterase